MSQRKPDKYPVVDPRLPNLYSNILKAAQSLRSVRLAEDSGARAAQRDREVAARLALLQREADEPVTVIVPNWTPTPVASGPVPALAASEDQT